MYNNNAILRCHNSHLYRDEFSTLDTIYYYIKHKIIEVQ